MSAIETITNFIATHIRDIVTICLVYLGGELILSLYARKIAASAKSKRAKTLAKLIHDIGHVVMLIMISFWLLRLFGVDPTPIIASAGVLGLAVGFGSQTLVKDFVSGMFIIAENQYAVGDEVKIGNFEGTVECLNVRSTVLRDKDGNKVYIPNGSISTVVNLEKR